MSTTANAAEATEKNEAVTAVPTERTDAELLEVNGLVKRFPLKRTIFDAMLHNERNALTAVDDVSLTLAQGETLGLVGESGCGKSTLARTIINLYRPTEGKVVFDGTDLASLSKRELRERCGDIQMIFQDPYSSLNPRMTVRQVLREVLLHRGACERDKVDAEVMRLLGLVGLSEDQADRLPSAFSGGQRQRIGIARNLLIDLKERLDLSILFISHDLRVVRYISDRVAVMYLGSIVETAMTDELYDHPLHPYTQTLLEAAPSMEESRVKETKTFAKGELPSPINMPSGCRFHPRCPYATERCKTERPCLRDAGDGHLVACHNPLEG